MKFEDLGTMPYRQAWDYQVKVHDEVCAGGEERVLIVEHPPVITFGRRPGVAGNVLASEEQLAKAGVEVVQSDRGGDVTFHGPGQIVAYPIIRLVDHHLTVGGFVHRLEDVVIAALRELGVEGVKDAKAPGVWVMDQGALRKICALGVRVRRGVSMHGIALNVTTDLRYFDLIVPCGLVGRMPTSLKQVGVKADWGVALASLQRAFAAGLRRV
jgi:lipoyl(octanoyl) transferase